MDKKSTEEYDDVTQLAKKPVVVVLFCIAFVMFCYVFAVALCRAMEYEAERHSDRHWLADPEYHDGVMKLKKLKD